MLDRPAEGRGRHRAVDDQRHPVRGGERGDAFDVQDGPPRVADGLAVEGPGPGRDRGLPLWQVRRVHEPDAYRELLERVDELGDGAAVQLRRRDDLVAGHQERQEGDELRGHAAGRRHRPCRALERRDALLKDGRRRVADPRVDVAVLLQLKELCRLLRVLENKRGRLVDRNRPGAGHRVRYVAGMDHPGVEPEAAGIESLLTRAEAITFPGQSKVRIGHNRHFCFLRGLRRVP